MKSLATILVVEDNEDLSYYIQSLLSDQYTVIAARNGREALEKLEEPKADISLILSDIMMPVMDGMELLEALKADTRWSHLPVIMLTARSGISQKLDALRLGVHDYLTKPFEEDELLVRIANMLAWFDDRKNSRSQLQPEIEVSDFSHEEKWMESVNEWLTQHYQNSDTKMMDWATSLNLSESQFRRRLKQATGLTPLQYLQEHRLQTGKMLLEKSTFSTVGEVAFYIGFSAPDYFSTLFIKRFGKRPSAV
jgi:CheY-like chemotaxis protein